MRISLQEARRQGEIAAARELIRLNVDQTCPVNIFRIIEKEQLWLLFRPFVRPFEGPMGTYIPGGILINSEWSLRIQRLTAAHEYGHHVLGHAPSIDGAGNLGDPLNINEIQEAAAQSFAMDFMMPVKLVNSQWGNLRLPPSIEPWQAYLLSLQMGTSYQATVYQLIAQERINLSQGTRFLKVKPSQIKAQVGGGIGPAQSRADVWLIGREQSGSKINVSVGDEIRLQLTESPATGYLWSVPEGAVRDGRQVDSEAYEHLENNTIFDLVRSEFDTIDRRLAVEGTGGMGSRYMTLRAMQPGKAKLQLQLRRPWAKQSIPRDEFALSVRISERVEGLLPEVKEVLLG